MTHPNNYRIVFTFGGAYEDVAFAPTLEAAKIEADDLITRDDREVYQAFS